METIINLQNCCKENDLYTFKSIVNTNYDIDFESLNDTTFIEICTIANDEIINWIFDAFPNINFRTNNWKALKILINLERNHISKYIINNYWSPISALEWACLMNNTKICDWIDKEYNLKELEISSIIKKYLLGYSVEKNNIEIFSYLLNMLNDIDNDTILTVLGISLKHNNIESANILLNRYPNIELVSDDNWLLIEVCSGGAYKSLLWLIDKEPKIKNLKDYDTLFIESCKSNNLDLVKWFINNYNIKIDKYDDLIYHLIVNDCIKILDYLFNNYRIDIPIHKMPSYIINSKSNDILEWFLNHNLIDINQSESISHVFLESVEKDNVKICNWILSKNDNIDFKLNRHRGFKIACENNNIQLANLYIKYNPKLYKLTVQHGDIISYQIFEPVEFIGTRDIENIENCTICMHKDSEVITCCNHVYCEQCINTWYSSNHTCPYCRKTDIVFYKINRI